MLGAFRGIHQCLLLLRRFPTGFIFGEIKKMNGTSIRARGCSADLRRNDTPKTGARGTSGCNTSSKPPLSLSTGRTNSAAGVIYIPLLQSRISKPSPSDSSACPQFFKCVFSDTTRTTVVSSPCNALFTLPVHHIPGDAAGSPSSSTSAALAGSSSSLELLCDALESGLKQDEAGLALEDIHSP